MYSSNTKIKNILIVAAAGFGKRMKLPYPKQFLKYDEKPLFLHSLLVGEKSEKIHAMLVITQRENIDKIREVCEANNIKKVYDVIEGGKERQESVYNGIKAIENIKNLDKNPIILVQDSVRPFFKEKYITDSIEELENNDKISGVIVGLPVKDTIKIVDDQGMITSTPVRKSLMAANTPQVFYYKVLKSAYENAENTNFMGTDDSSLVENIGGKVKVIMGDYDNIKITTPEDLEFIKKTK